MTTEEANAIYDILVRECEAQEWARAGFCAYAKRAPTRYGWRFRGALGFGGKVYVPHAGTMYPFVTCYVEDMSPERLSMVERANEALRKWRSSNEQQR